MSEGSVYRVPFEAAESEFTEKKSRFISHVWSVADEEAARAKIEAMKKRYHDARHNCWCYILHENGVKRYSDDGEPQGTAGRPMLNVFEQHEVEDVCCVVTRYFGGVLLGAGGLTRAYSRAARDALAASGIGVMRTWLTAELELPYDLYESVKRLAASHDVQITDTRYGADIGLSLLLPDGALQEKLTELSAGQLTLRMTGETVRPGTREELDAGRTNDL